jgi:hypothetical protein
MTDLLMVAMNYILMIKHYCYNDDIDEAIIMTQNLLDRLNKIKDKGINSGA